jgi:hypothetical protein
VITQCFFWAITNTTRKSIAPITNAEILWIEP